MQIKFFFSKYSAVIILLSFHLLIIEVANLSFFEILDIGHKSTSTSTIIIVIIILFVTINCRNINLKKGKYQIVPKIKLIHNPSIFMVPVHVGNKKVKGSTPS